MKIIYKNIKYIRPNAKLSINYINMSYCNKNALILVW
jgi:hypothetical protein